MDNNIIKVSHLQKFFGKNQVLKDVDFNVNEGDVTTIIGASGSGKSTLLRCINLLEKPSGGEILFHGKPITGKGFDPCSYRAKVGMCFQSFNLFNNMTVIENCIVESRDTIRANTRHVGENGVKIVVEKNERYAL